MKALSLWQPHAIAIGLGIKRFETRGWQLRAAEIGVPIAIHAAKKVFAEKDYPQEYFKDVRDCLRAAGYLLRDLDYGKVVCIATFSACVRTATAREMIGDGPEIFWGDFSDIGDDGKERWAFKIGDVRLIPAAQRPEITGHQGFFEVPNEIGLWGM
jgi:hypothetical protein